MRVLLAAVIAAGFVLSGPAFAKTVKECRAEYAANKAALRGAKVKEKDFLAQCKAGTETIPGGGAPSTAGAPSATTTGPASPAAPTPQPGASASPAAAGGGYRTEAEAKATCPGGTVVWVNPRSHIYHFAGTRDYGHTKSGSYMCEAAAATAGNRAAKNEKHP